MGEIYSSFFVSYVLLKSENITLLWNGLAYKKSEWRRLHIEVPPGNPCGKGKDKKGLPPCTTKFCSAVFDTENIYVSHIQNKLS